MILSDPKFRCLLFTEMHAVQPCLFKFTDSSGDDSSGDDSWPLIHSNHYTIQARSMCESLASRLSAPPTDKQWEIDDCRSTSPLPRDHVIITWSITCYSHVITLPNEPVELIRVIWTLRSVVLHTVNPTLSPLLYYFAFIYYCMSG